VPGERVLRDCGGLYFISYCILMVIDAVFILDEVLYAPPHEKSSDEFWAVI
jgi:hypothetical protein